MKKSFTRRCRVLDRHGSRWVVTVRSALTAPTLVIIATALTLPIFFAGWEIAGIAMGAVPYPPAFAALTPLIGRQLRQNADDPHPRCRSGQHRFRTPRRPWPIDSIGVQPTWFVNGVGSGHDPRACVGITG